MQWCDRKGSDQQALFDGKATEKEHSKRKVFCTERVIFCSGIHPEVLPEAKCLSYA